MPHYLINGKQWHDGSIGFDINQQVHWWSLGVLDYHIKTMKQWVETLVVSGPIVGQFRIIILTLHYSEGLDSQCQVKHSCQDAIKVPKCVNSHYPLAFSIFFCLTKKKGARFIM